MKSASEIRAGPKSSASSARFFFLIASLKGLHALNVQQIKHTERKSFLMLQLLPHLLLFFFTILREN